MIQPSKLSKLTEGRRAANLPRSAGALSPDVGPAIHARIEIRRSDVFVGQWNGRRGERMDRVRPQVNRRGGGEREDLKLAVRGVGTGGDGEPVDSGVAETRVEEVRDRVAFGARIEDPELALGDGEIEVPVPVGIAPIGARNRGQWRRKDRARIREHSAVVSPEKRGPGELLAAHEKIGIAVVVDVAPDSPDRSQPFVQSDRRGDVVEGKVAVVAVQRVLARRDPAPCPPRRRRGDLRCSRRRRSRVPDRGNRTCPPPRVRLFKRPGPLLRYSSFGSAPAPPSAPCAIKISMRSLKSKESKSIPWRSNGPDQGCG